MKRVATVLAVAAGFAAAASTAGATNECRGLQTCVPVAGPWVVAPSDTQVQFQLACPRSFVVGGLDAELSDRGVDIGFVGSLGSPVNPGITTSSSALFLGRLVHGRNRAASFRPHIGCVPARGGGERTPTAYRAFPPGKPSIRRVSQLTVRPGATRRLVARCGARERIAAATHALGFYGDAPPTPALVRTITVRQVGDGNRVLLEVKATRAAAGAGAVVQLDLVCVAQ